MTVITSWSGNFEPAMPGAIEQGVDLAIDGVDGPRDGVGVAQVGVVVTGDVDLEAL